MECEAFGLTLHEFVGISVRAMLGITDGLGLASALFLPLHCERRQ